ncbi:hypothetical protein VTK73DRAFT_1976 [Phialemonium thermophilum]|uniref:Uncharacterized protein n=1 Tax=Phialemonium thermophilum TaxID=223376 RepID=A0ABR3X776_9PEZI
MTPPMSLLWKHCSPAKPVFRHTHRLSTQAHSLPSSRSQCAAATLRGPLGGSPPLSSARNAVRTHGALPPALRQPASRHGRSFVLSRPSFQSQDPGSSGKNSGKESPLRKVLTTAVQRENIYTLPNALTLSRLVAAPFVGWSVLHDHHAWALGLFAYAGVTDLLDGWIARRWNQKTVVGTVIDPMADKTLVTVLVVALATKGALPLWLAAIILGRDIGLGIAAIYYRWISLPPPKTFARYWDFTLPSAEVRPTTISKYNTALQLALLGMTTIAPVATADLATPLTILQYVVATTTIWSGASYVYSKDAVRILSQTKKDTADPK